MKLLNMSKKWSTTVVTRYKGGWCSGQAYPYWIIDFTRHKPLEDPYLMYNDSSDEMDLNILAF